MREKWLIGYDLSDNYAQISFLSDKAAEPETLSVLPGAEKYHIPLCLCKRKGFNQWFYGMDALKHKEEGELVTDLFQLAKKGEPVVIEETGYDPIALLTLYVKRSLSGLSVIGDTDHVGAFMFSCESLDERTVEVLKQVAAGLSLKTKNFFYQNYAESFYQYMVHQPEDIWVRQVLVCDYHSDVMKIYRMECNRRTTPMVVYIEKDERNFFACGDYPEEEEKKQNVFTQMDEKMLTMAQELAEGQMITSVYLIGEGFSEEWMKESLRFLCRNRRVFQGNNLYSKGACYALRERLYPTEISGRYVFLGEDKLKANIGMKVYRQGESSYLALLDAGVSWYDARFQTEVYLEEGNSFDIVLTPLNGKDARYGKVTLTGLPERKTPTRLYIEISMTGENKVRLYVEDLGFGELSPSGYQKWTENFEI